MQLENLASPFATETPNRRYAALHRAAERGMASDATWRELVEVCLRLEKDDEALSAYGRIEDPAVRHAVTNLLVRRGLLQPAPAVTPEAQEVEVRDTLRDRVLDATQVLFDEHMPLTVIVTTTTFPLVVGLVGFLSTKSSFVFFPLLALLPALCVLGLVGALGRRILVESASGIQDAPRIPALPELTRESGRFLLDMLVLAGALLVPGFVFAALGEVTLAVPAFVLAALIMPMALTIRQLTDDWRALSPKCIFPAITRLRGEYFGPAAVCAALFLPAGIALLLTLGSKPYLQASVVGPLLVAPLFVCARLMGRVIDDGRDRLVDLLDLPRRVVTTEAPLRHLPTVSELTRRRQATAAAAGRPPAQARPTAPRQAQARPQPPARPQAQARPQTQARPQPPARPQAPRKPRAAAGNPGAAPVRNPVRRPAAQPVPATGARRPQPPRVPEPHPLPTDDVPVPKVDIDSEAPVDFTKMPGFNVVSGAARVLAGAAASPGKRRK